jgi:F-type H+-transporting ATPase subunit delta
MKDHHSTLSRTYARSLLELANEGGQTQEVANDVDVLGQALAENPSFVEFLKDPGISHEERREALGRIFAGKLNVLLDRLLQIMSERGRLAILPEVLDAFEALLDEQLGKVEVDVTVAQRLGEDELEDVRRRVSKALSKDAVIHQYVDEDIIGGIILRVGDQVVDASVRRQLEAMRQRMLKGHS